MVRLLAVLVLAGASLQAQTITETFGSGANQFQIEFVTIGNANNAPDTGTDFWGRPYLSGAVGYVFNLGKFEVSRDMVMKAEAEAGLGITLADMPSNTVNRPATGLTWSEAAKFVNWLNTSSGGVAAYKFNAEGKFEIWNSENAGFQPNNPFRNSLARFFLPSIDEWYKGAFYDPNKNGSGSGGYWKFATGTDQVPVSVSGGTSFGTAVWGNSPFPYADPADVDNAGGLSAYGTMGQTGNVWEWNESAFDGSNDDAGELRDMNGGAWASGEFHLESSYRGSSSIDSSGNSGGFRIAMVPEPTSLSLLFAGGAVLMAGRRRKS